MTYSIVQSKGRVIRADYGGGAYIELTFGSEGYKPTEVINVWDYEAGHPEPPFDGWDGMTSTEARDAVRVVVKTWIADTEAEGWLDWFEGYLENAR